MSPVRRAPRTSCLLYVERNLVPGFRQDPEFGSGNPPFSLQGADSPFLSLSFPRPPVRLFRPLACKTGRRVFRVCILFFFSFDSQSHASCGVFPFAAKPPFQQSRHSRHPCVPGIPAMRILFFRRNIATCASSAHVWRSFRKFLGFPGVRSLPSLSGLLEAASCAVASVR